MNDQRFTGKFHCILDAYPIAHGDKHLILHCLYPNRPLEQFHVLGLGVGGWDDNHVSAFQDAGSDAFRQVAVVADHDADFAKGGVEHLEAIV